MLPLLEVILDTIQAFCAWPSVAGELRALRHKSFLLLWSQGRPGLLAESAARAAAAVRAKRHSNEACACDQGNVGQHHHCNPRSVSCSVVFAGRIHEER